MTESRRHFLTTALAATAHAPIIRAAEPAKLASAIRLVILDVGGTIIEDRGDVPETLRSVMAARGITIKPAEISQFRGASKRAMVRHFVEQRTTSSAADREKLSAEIYADFRQQLNEIYRSVPPVAGAEATIRKLREDGYLVATTTGFDRDIATPIFRRLGWEKYFAASVCSDDVTEGRPAPFLIFHAMEQARINRVSEVVAVGDTPLDLQAASNAGVRGVVGVCTGAFSRERLLSEPHTHILPSVADLPALLSSKFRAAPAG